MNLGKTDNFTATRAGISEERLFVWSIK